MKYNKTFANVGEYINYHCNQLLQLIAATYQGQLHRVFVTSAKEIMHCIVSVR